MEYIADLHIHSPFSRATSKTSDLNGLFAWANVKGINVIGTGDFTHPGWFAQLKELLEPAEPGFFKLKDEKDVPPVLNGAKTEPIPVRFVLTSEISSIYKRDDKVRKVHNILYAPDFESVEKINTKLASIGNIESDGRPILGLDSRNLLEILLEKAPEGFLVPAHIWTPWFSLFGSKSGFDDIEGCFGDLTKHIFALETGLSSDPDMNRMISALDKYALISNSDCHSPSKLGREANLFDAGYDFFSMRDALKESGNGKFQGTIEFFPEEGKYHLDGHRKCGVRLEPEETLKTDSLCPACNKPLTIGVVHRVIELADRKKPLYQNGAPGFKSLIPLPEVLGEILQVGPASKKVQAEYARVIGIFGSDFNLLTKTPIEDVIHNHSTLLGEAIKRMREGKVIRRGGFDGEFGVIRVFETNELEKLAGQLSLFSPEKKKKATKTKKEISSDTKEKVKAKKSAGNVKKKDNSEQTLNDEQLKAIECDAKIALVSAGPGTGKTFTLISRIARMISKNECPPEQFAAITFTNRAANEIKERLEKQIGADAGKIFTGTFHGFCLKWLRKADAGLTVVGGDERAIHLKKLFRKKSDKSFRELSKSITEYYHNLSASTQNDNAANQPKIKEYIDYLVTKNCIDLDSVIPLFVQRLVESQSFSEMVCDSISRLFIDEFQDLNRSQYELTTILAKNAAVFAIGDPNQAIYGFRGSDLNYFFQFENDFNAQTLPLVRNYRSAPSIIEAATAVIQNNTQKGSAIIEAQVKSQTIIENSKAFDPQAEADFIARRIESFVGGSSHRSIDAQADGDENISGDKGFSDIAVLYRLSKQADIIGKTLDKLGIPFQAVDAPPFFMHKDVRVAYYITRMATNPNAYDYIFLLKTIQACHASAMKLLERELPVEECDIFKIVKNLDVDSDHAKIFKEIERNIKDFNDASISKGLRTGLENALDIDHMNTNPDLPAAKRLIELGGAFGKDLAAFSAYLKQNSCGTVYDDKAEAVSLMTLHASKGLEFPVVFITGLEDGIMPCDINGFSCKLEEERRLFYVGVTRAKENLVLSRAGARSLFGKSGQQKPSRFINEIPQKLLKDINIINPKKKKPVQLTLFDDF